VISIKEDTQKMAELLRTGHTMLNLSCPVCNNPLFRNRENEMFCPVCNRLVQFLSENQSDITPSKNTSELKKDNKKSVDNNQTLNTINSLRIVLIKKLEFITQELDSETQLNLISSKLSIISEILKLLNITKNKQD
jgi:uncharacterized Zn finger protein (UPF0148 family)